MHNVQVQDFTIHDESEANHPNICIGCGYADIGILRDYEYSQEERQELLEEVREVVRESTEW